MAGSNENNPTLLSHSNIQGGLQARGGKVMAPIGHNRRALKDINCNITGVPPHPSAVNKAAPFQKDARAEGLPPNPVQRPITRKFAAQMAKMQDCVIEVTKQSNHCVSYTSKDLEYCGFIDVDDHKLHNETPVPMFVQHTEAMLEEIDRMDEEIEMEDKVDEPILDIDSNDKDNPLAVTEYIDEIYAYYKKVEPAGCVPTNYMDKQSEINERMRAILIDWLIEVHYKFELMEETLYLTVSLIDRFLALHPVVRKKLQLVGVTAMLLACKYEEVSVPVVEDLILISDRAYTRQEVLQMERLMINTLKFNLSLPTPYAFMRRFLKAAEADKKLELLSFFLIELCLVEYQMLRFQPSLLAASAVFTAQSTLNGCNYWTKTCEWYSGYSQEQLLECSRLMVSFHQKAETGKLTGVHRKYSTSKFGYAAKYKPALFLMESRGFSGWTNININ